MNTGDDNPESQFEAGRGDHEGAVLDLHDAYSRLGASPSAGADVAGSALRRIRTRSRRRRSKVALGVAVSTVGVIFLGPALIQSSEPSRDAPAIDADGIADGNSGTETTSPGPAAPSITPEPTAAVPTFAPKINCRGKEPLADTASFYLLEEDLRFATPEEAVAVYTGGGVDLNVSRAGEATALRPDATPYAVFSVQGVEGEGFGVDTYTRCVGEGPWVE